LWGVAPGGAPVGGEGGGEKPPPFKKGGGPFSPSPFPPPPPPSPGDERREGRRISTETDVPVDETLGERAAFGPPSPPTPPPPPPPASGLASGGGEVATARRLAKRASRDMVGLSGRMASLGL